MLSWTYCIVAPLQVVVLLPTYWKFNFFLICCQWCSIFILILVFHRTCFLELPNKKQLEPLHQSPSFLCQKAKVAQAWLEDLLFLLKSKKCTQNKLRNSSIALCPNPSPFRLLHVLNCIHEQELNRFAQVLFVILKSFLLCLFFHRFVLSPCYAVLYISISYIVHWDKW